MISAIRSSASAIAKDQPQQLFALQRDIEVVALDAFILRFSEMLGKKLKESACKPLRRNPFVLSLLFGYPIVLVLSQAHVGGTTLSGRGGKIADFMVKNEATSNVALVEIKTPHTPLLANEFRGGAHQYLARLSAPSCRF